MSRIGKAPITLPEAVTVEVSDKNVVSVKGKLGELQQTVNPAIKVKVEDGQVVLERTTNQKQHRAYHGLYRALIASMVKGVSEGFTIEQELVGVGYRVQAKGQTLDLTLGYAHNVLYELPSEVKVEAKTEKGKNPIIKLTSANAQLVGQIAAKIRSLRKPEPYKGKGIKFVGENIRRKAGKAVGK